MITQIYHKKNELFEVEFYKDKECTQAFDFMDKEDLYIELLNGDCTPVLALSHKLWRLGIKAHIFTPFWYLGFYDGISPQTPVITLNDVLCNDELQNVNLSKYIPEDNAVLFLTQNDFDNYRGNLDPSRLFIRYKKDGLTEDCIGQCSKITIFLPHGTQSELQKAEEVAKELKEKYGVEEVNLFALHCFYDDGIKLYQLADLCNKLEKAITQKEVNKPIKMYDFNKIITTNSAGILRPINASERLQVIDAKEIFEEYLKENNL